MTLLPRLYYITSRLSEDNAFETWRAVLAPLFEPRAWDRSTKQPAGSAAGVIIGDIIVAKVIFGAQDFVRDAARIAATPDHLLLHLYLSGGFTGLVTGQRTKISPGQVAVIDLAKEVNTRAFASNTLSLIVPRKLIAGLAGETLKPVLDLRRNELLSAHIRSLQERSTELTEDDVEATVRETAELLQRLIAPSRKSRRDDIDEDVSALTETAIRDNLAQGDLSPEWLAQKLGISRASLYRVFTKHGGIMQYVQERRLIAVRAALSDPLEIRPLSRIAADLGFNSKAHFSRAFRIRFGMTASAFRRARLDSSAATQLTSPEVVQKWWLDVASRDLGKRESS